MYFPYSNFNRYKLTKTAFTIFVLLGILNWTFVPNLTTFAEREVLPEEIPVSEPAPESELEEASSEEPVVEDPVETGKVVIDTGDAVASSDTVNEVNTNEVNSTGEIMVVSGSLGDSSLDLREAAASGTTTSIASTTEEQTATTTPNQSLLSSDVTGQACSNCVSDLTIENQNTATVTNEIIVTADTGGNSASSTARSTIQTGDAYAGANLVNIVNTNIVDSRYMLLVFNNFGDWSGDLVFPNGDFFVKFLSLFNPKCNCSGNVNISNTNQGDIANNVDTSANSGNNTINGDGSTINTGDALASSNTYNLVNTNVYGSSSFYLLIKVFGDWNGNIFNLPDGLAWQNTNEGLVLYSKDSDFGGSGSGGNLNIIGDNSVDITNNVNVSANTGGNHATGTEAFVNTGNAYAGSNTVNIINTNIISSNWMVLLLNVFGHWNGNISFGQPDLWVGTRASVNGAIEAGSSVTFTTTVKNNGDARASNINIISLLKTSYFRFMQNYSGFHQHTIDSLDPGESIEFTYYGLTERLVPDDRSDVVIDTSVTSFETDGNRVDNTDRISFAISHNPGAIILPQTSFSSSYPDLSVIKSHTLPSTVVIDGEEYVPAGSSVDYKIVIRNNGGKAYKGILYDELVNETGELVNDQYWELNEIFPNEEISITYTAEFDEATLPGLYTNYAWVEAVSGESIAGQEKQVISNTAEDKVFVQKKIELADTPEMVVPEILGVTTTDIEIEREEQVMEFLGGFCSEDREDGQQNKFGLTHTALLGLSFILVVERAKKAGISLMMF